MTFTFKLERLDGTPADPPSSKTTLLAWSRGDRGSRRPRQAGVLLSTVWAYPLELCLSRALGQEITGSGNTAR
jgi:hypothetical protein